MEVTPAGQSQVVELVNGTVVCAFSEVVTRKLKSKQTNKKMIFVHLLGVNFIEMQ